MREEKEPRRADQRERGEECGGYQEGLVGEISVTSSEMSQYTGMCEVKQEGYSEGRELENVQARRNECGGKYFRS